MRTRQILNLLLALLMCVSGFAADVRADDRPDTPGTAVISSFLQVKLREVEGLERNVSLLEEQQKEREATFKPFFATALERMQMIEVMARMAKGNPYDMRVTLTEAKYLQASLTKEFLPLENLSKEVGLQMVTIQTLEQDLERKWAAGLDNALRQEVQVIRSGVAVLGQRLKEIQNKYDKTRGVITDLQVRLLEKITTFEALLPQTIKAEFLDRKEFHLLPAQAETVSTELADWSANMKAFIRSQIAAMGLDTADWIGSVLLFLFLFLAVGAALFRWLSDVFENTYAGGRRTSAAGILCLSISLSFLASFFLGTVKQSSFLLVITNALMLLGVQALGWVFRNVRGVLQAKSAQPLLPLVFLSMSVALLDMLRLPVWLEHLVWVGLLVLSSLFFGMIKPPLRYEQFVRSAHPFVMATLVAVAIAGWGNLAMLASTLWGVLALAIQLAMGATSVMRVFLEKHGTGPRRALIADLAVTCSTLLIWFAAAFGILAWVAINMGTNVIFEKVSSLEFNWGEFSFSFLRLGIVLILFQVVLTLAKAWKAVLESDHLFTKSFDRGAAASLQRIGIYCLWLLYGFISVYLLGINMTNFAFIAGGLSVGIGFGMQAIISNFISGLILLFDRAIQPGDVIEINGMWAKVMSVNIRNTEVQTFENAKIFVPNSALISNQVTNWTSRNDVSIRRDVTVGVAYGSDVSLVKRLLLEAASEQPTVMNTPAPLVIFSNFGASSLDFILRFWVRHVDFSVSAPSEIREAIDQKFREHGIEIPFAQMDLHVRGGDGLIRVQRATI